MSQNHRSIDSIFIGFTVIQTHLEAWEVWRRSFSTEHSESLVKPEHEQYQKSGGGGGNPTIIATCCQGVWGHFFEFLVSLITDFYNRLRKNTEQFY